MYTNMRSRIQMCGWLILVLLSLAAAPPRKISLDVKDADLHNVMRLLADAGKVNIVVPDDVKGRVTIKLRDVPWTEALDVILRSKGLGREMIGSVVQVDTLERILARDRARIEMNKAQVEAAEPITVLIPLSYANANELKALVQSMLSPKGSVAVDARTNTLIVTDVPERIDRVQDAVAR